MILITGAAGKTGQSIVKVLKKHAISSRVFLHRAEYQPMMTSIGATETVLGDIQDQEDLVKAASGVDAIYHICPNMHPEELTIARRVIFACQRAGCERIIYHSVFHPQAKKMAHHWQKCLVEEQLFESKLIYTVLQPTAYMQNFLGYWRQITSGKFPVPYPVETRISLLDIEDLAQVAFRVLTESSHDYATYELVGTEPLSQVDIALALSEHMGYKVQAEQIPLDVWKKNAELMGMPQYAKETLISMFEYYRDFGLFGNQNTLQFLLQHEPTSFNEFLARIPKS